MMSRCCCPAVSSLGTSGFSRSLRNSSRLSASPPFLLFLSSSGTSGVRHLVNIWKQQKQGGRTWRKLSPLCKYSWISVPIRLCYLQQPRVPERLSGEREKLLNASCLLPHHQLLGRRCQVQCGDNVRVIRQLSADGFTIQLLHTVHNQLPFAFCLGFLYCTDDRDEAAQKRKITFWSQGTFPTKYCRSCLD